jgi:hypothetical protein
VLVTFSPSMDEPSLSFGASCEAGLFRSPLPLRGTYTVHARATTDDRVVATSPESAPIVFTAGQLIDVGVLTLSPCGAACPEPGG